VGERQKDRKDIQKWQKFSSWTFLAITFLAKQPGDNVTKLFFFVIDATQE